MIKQVTLAFKKPGLTTEEFNRHWKEIHGPMFAKQAPGVKRYVQNHFIPMPGLKYLGDGIAETWFDDLKSQQKLTAWLQSSAGKELMDDGAQFMTSEYKVWFLNEHFVMKGGVHKTKEMGIVYRKPGMTREEFNKYWKDVHGPFSARRIPRLRKYIQNYVIPIPGVEYDGDGIVEIWFDSIEDLNNFDAYSRTAEAKDMMEDAANFVDTSKKILWICEEHVMK